MKDGSRLLIIAVGAAAAIGGGVARGQAPTPPDSIVTTRHQVAVGGRTIGYTARAGLLPLRVNDTGELMARMFFISYTVDRAPGEPPRPITFAWNGGPGSNAAQVHVVGFGPRRIRTADTYPTWGASIETALVDHEETWLDATDLVFVDPIGTGFSRATSEANRDVLYTTRGDIEAVAEFIRLYLTRFGAWDAPVFLAGESYGTTRAMGVVEALESRRTRVAGVVLISGGYDAGQAMPPELNQALQVPMFTAAAHHHGRLPADLQRLAPGEAVKRATEWARNSYAPALARRDSLPAAERASVLAQLERFTGVPGRFAGERTMVLSKDVFSDRLLEDRGLELGRYDFRMTTKSRGEKTLWLPFIDPSLRPMLDLMQGTSRLFNSYVRDTLRYRSDLLYRGPFGEAFHPLPLVTNPAGYKGDWMAVMWNRGEFAAPAAAGRPGAGSDSVRQAPPLQRAMERNPRLLVMNARGLYDISCAQMDEAVARTPAALRPRVRNACYAGGHMFYSDRQPRVEFKRDFSQFVRDALAARGIVQQEGPPFGRPPPRSSITGWQPLAPDVASDGRLSHEHIPVPAGVH